MTKKKSGRSHTPPKNEARPLGTKRHGKKGHAVPAVDPFIEGIRNRDRTPVDATTPDDDAHLAGLEDAIAETFTESLLDKIAALPDPTHVIDDVNPIDTVPEKTASSDDKPLDTPIASDVRSTPSPDDLVTDTHTETKGQTMELTLVQDHKARKTKWNFIVFGAEGYRGSVRFSKAFFTDGKAPDSLVLANDAFGGPKAPATKLTADERKALRASKPKPTAAERLAKLEQKAATLRAKIASEPVAVGA